MTYKELFEKGKNMLPGEEASIEAAILLESILDTNRNDLFLNPDGDRQAYRQVLPSQGQCLVGEQRQGGEN